MNMKILKHAELSAMEKLVYIVIDAHKSADGKTIISYNQISGMASVSRRTAITMVENLVNAGLVKKDTIETNFQTVNQYTPLLDGDGE